VTAVVPRDQRTERAARIRKTADLIAAIVSDVAEIVDTHADDIAEWWAQRRQT
jgi:hypothetical protein